MADDFNKREVLIEVEVDSKQAEKQVDSLTGSILAQKDAVKANTDEIKKLEKENKSLNDEVTKGTKTRDEANKQIEENSKRAFELKKANESVKDGVKDLNRERQAAVKAMKTQSNSLDALRVRSAKLKKELNAQETATEKGRKAFDKLQKELKETNDQIRDLDKGAGDFKTNVGNYPDLLNDMGEGLDTVSAGAGSAATGFVNMAKAAMGFILTPVGAVLGALVGAFLLIQNAMSRSEEETNKITKAFSAFEGIINFVLKALEPLGVLLIDGIVKGFELAGAAAEGAMGLISDGLSFLGFDDAAESVDNFTSSINDSVVAAAELADMEAELQTRQRESAKIQLEFQKQAEKLRQIRDDDSKSIEERISANERLGDVLKEQLKEEQAIADLRLDAVNKRIQAEGETTELLDARAEALTEIADIQERITGQESEQLTNRNALLKEANDAQLEALEQSRAIEAEEKERKEEELEEEAEALEERRSLEADSLETHLEKLNQIREEKSEEAKKIEDEQNKVIENSQKKSAKVSQSILDTASNIVENRYKSRFDNLEKQFKSGQITEEEYARKKLALEKKQAMDEWRVKKAAYVIDQITRTGQIIGDTARAVSASLAAFPATAGQPWAGINIGIGATQLANVATTPPPPKPTFKEGGIVVEGRSHAQGGEDIYVGGKYAGEMEGGEGLFVTKRAATTALLNDYNTSHGGRSLFGTSTRYAQEGGRIEADSNNQATAAMVMEAMQQMPAPQVQVVDIQSGVQGNEEATNIAVI